MYFIVTVIIIGHVDLRALVSHPEPATLLSCWLFKFNFPGKVDVVVFLTFDD